MNQQTSEPRLDAIVRWLFGEVFTFRHRETGRTHSIRARNRNAAIAKMRAMLITAMYGGFVFTYCPESVDRELEKCEII